MPEEAFVCVRTTPDRKRANEYALVLNSQGLHPEVSRTSDGFEVRVRSGEDHRASVSLDAYEREPVKLARHALKVMLSFSLMIHGRIERATLPQFLSERPIYADINRRFLRMPDAELCDYLVRDLERAGALKQADGWLLAA